MYRFKRYPLRHDGDEEERIPTAPQAWKRMSAYDVRTGLQLDLDEVTNLLRRLREFTFVHRVL